MSVSEPANPVWFLYIARCDRRLYTGITTNLDRRLAEHRSGGARAARFTRAARLVDLVYWTEIGDHSTALRIEHRVKRLPRQQKLAIVAESPDGDALRRRLLSTPGPGAAAGDSAQG